jgi:hypothetical protein
MLSCPNKSVYLAMLQSGIQTFKQTQMYLEKNKIFTSPTTSDYFHYLITIVTFLIQYILIKVD